MYTKTPYIKTKALSNRLCCSERTLFRRIKRSYNPLPKPVIKNKGSSNLWLIDDILEWEMREVERSKRLESCQ